MNEGVAIGAGRTHHGLPGVPRSDVVTAVKKTGMEGFRMTTLAEKRLTYRQHPVLGGTMRIVTNSTVFADRLMFPEKWPPFFRMAAGAGFIDSIAA